MYCCDSLLLRLEATEEVGTVVEAKPAVGGEELRVPTVVPVTLSEPNVYVLDMAEYSLDGEPFHEEEEILRLSSICKGKLGWPLCVNVQPWAIPEEPSEHHVTLRFTIHSEIEAEGVRLAMEEAEWTKIWMNGKEVPTVIDGWYTDKCIQTVTLPKISKGETILTVDWPLGKRTSLEWCYLLGDFGVRVIGSKKILIPPVRQLGFGDVTGQGLPFYGGNITYHIPYHGEGELELVASQYRGALLKVAVDGAETGRVVFPPYRLALGHLAQGEHTVDVTLFGTRINTFGQLHYVPYDNIDKYYHAEGTIWSTFWFGPDFWRTTGDAWSYDYQLHQVGILATPRLIKK